MKRRLVICAGLVALVGVALYVGRFIGLVRVLSPFIAGASRS